MVPSCTPGLSPGGCSCRVMCLACCLAKTGENPSVFPTPLDKCDTWGSWAHSDLSLLQVGLWQWMLDPSACSGVFRRLRRMGMAQARDWIPTAWAGKHRRDLRSQLTSTLQAAPWVKQCLGAAGLVAAVLWQHSCVSGGGSSRHCCGHSMAALCQRRSFAEITWISTQYFCLAGRSGICLSIFCAISLQEHGWGVSLSPAVAPLAGVPGVGSDGWWKTPSFPRIKGNPSHARGWMEWAGSSVQLGLGSGLRSKPGCSRP